MTRRTKTEGMDQALAKTPEQREAEKRDRFVRLAAKRVNNALRTIRNVARLANKATYSYTVDEAERITSAIKDASNAVQDGFYPDDNGPQSFYL